MTIEEYERTWEQNEDFGLNDMKVEGYENDAIEAKTEAKEEGGEVAKEGGKEEKAS